ncbi:hypothetical protein EJ05DRAFT_93400 [Pseudovirgaria hyperparasitica]|uniref:Uncharacterized protein n=1 Tax=Pseudovirgaria hyperparasitica TaxID=470096 RepID=A0A6A6W0Y5_9PEZI|nr:uncharacterized protein EJ05DRAFT_93400 [Pseudovirgaria hyperparasitica]KAF2756203.1 hypothetical protein EJ05DRAFT_93400 [Pseudovirgaria hyperparasitica]
MKDVAKGDGVLRVWETIIMALVRDASWQVSWRLRQLLFCVKAWSGTRERERKKHCVFGWIVCLPYVLPVTNKASRIHSMHLFHDMFGMPHRTSKPFTQCLFKEPDS